jgi:hypothetical protein
VSDKTANIKYKRLVGSSKGMLVRNSLWLGDDHLLAVRSSGYIENYARFYLKDIGGLVWRRTNRWLIVALIQGILILLMMLAAASTYDGTFNAMAVFLLIIGSPVLFAFLWNLFRGPSCSCQIITPLGPTDLDAVGRVKDVEKLLLKIRPLVTQAQGSLPRSELLARYQTLYFLENTSQAQ